MLRLALSTLDARLGRRALLWTLVLFLLALGLSAVPLFDLLGYDFSFAVGLVAALAAADMGQGAVAAARRTRRPSSLQLLTSLAVIAALGVLVLPLGVSLLNALRVKNCNLGSGAAFYALLPVATALYAAPAGVLAGVLFPRRGRLVALALPLLSLGWSLLRLYRDPAVFALDPFGGYFPGPIYDEALTPPARLVWYRLVNLIWIGTALVAVAALSAGGRPGPAGPPALTLRWRQGSRPALVLALVLGSLLVISSAALFFTRGRWRFHVRHQDLQSVLSRRTESQNFVVHSDPSAGESSQDLALVHRDLEFRHWQLERLFGIAPAGRIVVYRFSHPASKKDLVGAGATLYAKPWTREVFLQAERFPSRRFRHELAHVFAGAFGDPIFGISLAWRLPFPRLASGLVEGIAEAADFGDPDGRATLHQDARAMILDGRAPPLAKVVGAGFTAVSGPRAYTLAGSFCHFLLQEHGAERLRALYRSGGDFLGVYGQPLSVIEGRWRAFLETQPLAEAERAQAAERFRRPAIFRKVCARELAARVADARGRLGTAPEEAVALLASVCRDDPSEPSYRLDLAEALAFAGRSREALAWARAVEDDEATTRPLRLRAATLAAQAHFHAEKREEARLAVRRVQTYATEQSDERTALAKLRALADPDARRTLGRVLFGDAPGRGTDPALVVFLISEFARLNPGEALGPYLLGRQLAWRDPALAVPLLRRACAEPGTESHAVPLTPPFSLECRRLLAETAFRGGAPQDSRAAFERLHQQATTEADRLRANDWLERIDFEATAARRIPASAP